MGAAAGPVGAVSSIASAGLTAFATIEKGKGEQAADEYSAARAEQAAQYADTAAAQTDAQDRENLNLQLENIDVVRAASGADPLSPTTAAIRDKTSMLGDRARGIQVDNIIAQANQDRNDASYLHQAGGFAMSMANLNAAAGVAGTAAKTNWGSFGIPS